MGYSHQVMLSLLKNYIILADTNVWLSALFRATTGKSEAIRNQMRVPYQVMQELTGLQNSDVASNAKAALKFIHEQKIQVFPKSSVSRIADREFILYCMANEGSNYALISNDDGLKEDLKELCPCLLLLGWDEKKKKCTMEEDAYYKTLAQRYKSMVVSARMAESAGFTQRAVRLLASGMERLLVSPSLPKDHPHAAGMKGIPGLLHMDQLGLAGEKAALLSRLLVHDGEQRVLLLLAEDEDSQPYKEWRNKKLKSVDNAGFDIAVMNAAGDIKLVCQGANPLSKRKKAPEQHTPSPVAVPAAEHPGCQAIQQAVNAGNTDLATTRLVKPLKDCLEKRKYAQANQLLDAAKNCGIEQPKSILNSYLNEVLGAYAKDNNWPSLKTRFTGKEGKKMLTRLIQNAPTTDIAAAPTQKLNEWKKLCKTDEQREVIKAFESIIQYAKDKKNTN